MKKLLCTLLSLVLAVSLFVGCSSKDEKKPSIKLATTTSTQDSGLLDYILPKFEKETGYKVEVISTGTGKAIKHGEAGDVDVILVHAKADEEKFVAEGHGVKRLEVMYNDFVIVGPKNDPANIKNIKNAAEALKAIYEKKLPFISRGDDSGTHKFENKLWKKVNITPQGDNYVSAGKGMGDVLIMANEKDAYTISDRGTYLSMKDKLESLGIDYEKSDDLKNQYGIITVNPDKNKDVNSKGANELVKWITSEKVQNDIKSFGIDKYGEPLFIPNAK